MIFLIFAFIAIILTGIAQILLKMGSKNKVSVYCNKFSIIGYFLLFIVTIFGILALKGLDLKFYYALTSLNYILILIFSYIILKEEITKNKIMGIILIVWGIIIFNL